ncbi:MAG: ATP synthase F1 subunit delta [Acidobacteriota bacterium]
MSRRIARPYAAALFGVLAKQDPRALREVEAQLAAVGEVFRREPRLLRLFEVPAVPPARKREVLQAVGQALGLRREAQRLLAALAQHMRLRFLPDVVAAFRELVDRREGVARGTLTVPAAPDVAQLEAVGGALSALTGSRVELEAVVRPEMLAGFVVRMGSRVFDGSLRSRLNRFAAASQQAGR